MCTISCTCHEAIFMHSSLSLALALRPLTASPLLFRQRIGSLNVISALRKLTMGTLQYRAALKHPGVPSTAVAATPVVDEGPPEGLLERKIRKSGVRQAGSTPSTTRKAKRKVALHVAYCGTGFQGECSPMAIQNASFHMYLRFLRHGLR